MVLNNQISESEAVMGPVKSALYYACKYGLGNIFDSFINGGNSKDIESVKKHVKSVIFNHESQQWKASCLLYPQLNIYMHCVTNIRLHLWWSLAQVRPHYTRKISAVVAVLTDCQPRGLQCNIGRTFCKICNNRAVDDSLHVLLKCEALIIPRETGINSIIQSMPDNMKTSYSQLTDLDKIVFMLSGLKCDRIITEWAPVLFNICDYVYAVYTERKKIYDAIE